MAAGNTYMSHEADDVTVVQQHTVFVELVLEDSDAVEEIHEFGAVVGLVKECKQQAEVFDNAVLWFNDQFLFGDKRLDDTERNVSDDDALGRQPPQRTYDHDGHVDEVQQDWEWEGDEKQPGFLGASELRERWGGCFIPDGFMHAIGHEDPYGYGGVAAQQEDPTGKDLIKSGPDTIRKLIDLDNSCNGCVFEYEATFYITDPNGIQWMVDKLVYPPAFGGDLFGSGGGEDCYDGSGLTGFEDPRSTGVHADECQDPDNGDGDENHRFDEEEENDTPLHRLEEKEKPIAEPLYTVHVQVDPATGTGFADEAPWRYADENPKETAPRKGMPYALDEDNPVYQLCKENQDLRDSARPCAIEYNFLIAIDFEAFDQYVGGNYQESNMTHGESHNNTAADGDSHPHNPKTKDRGPEHDHSTVDLDMFFYDKAPHFVQANPYWDESGAPPSVTDDCSTTADDENYSDERRSAVENRAVIVCNTSSDSGSFHMHDGSQTM